MEEHINRQVCRVAKGRIKPNTSLVDGNRARELKQSINADYHAGTKGDLKQPLP